MRRAAAETEYSDQRVFLVRMWRSSETHWRGSIRSIATGRTVYVSGAHELSEFIARMLEEAESP